MTDGYRILTACGEGYYEEKRSRFLALAAPAESEEEALRVVAERRKRYFDARHHCYAFCIGKNIETARSSDDGEPSGTAGRPIRDVLEGSGLTNTLIVVTRYFGGTLLGTGGLIRAYTAAAKDALEHAKTAEVVSGEEWQLLCDYADKGRIDRILEDLGIVKLGEDYLQDVTMHLFLTPESIPLLQAQAADATAGSALLEKTGEREYLLPSPVSF